MERGHHTAPAFVGLLEGLTKENNLRMGTGSRSTSETCGRVWTVEMDGSFIDSYPWVKCPLPIFVVKDTMENEVDMKVKKSVSAERVLTGW